MAPDDPMEVVREKMWVERPAGTHLSQAGTTGGYSTLARDDDTNKLETHATLFPIVEDDADEADPVDDSSGSLDITNNYYDESARAEEPSELQKLLGALLVLGALKAAEKLAPRARSLWNDRALPAVKARWSRSCRARRSRKGAMADASAIVAGTSADSSGEVVVALETYRASMSSAEARERLVAAVRARLFSDEQLRVLREARIEVDGTPSQVERAMGELTPQQLVDSVTLMLEMDSSSFDEAAFARLGDVLGSRREDGPHVVVEYARIEQAPRQD